MSEKGVRIREWGTVYGSLGNRFPLKTRESFLSGKAIQQKGLLWAGTSPSIISISKVSWELRDGDVIEGVLGLNAGVGMVLSEVSVRHESL